jgi:ubiquinone/menaquinone biosynthesis C-methylase UbiE
MKLNLGSGAHPLRGFKNLDRPEWQWSQPLPCADGSIEAITISHALMYCPEMIWPSAFGEMHRVLASGGIVRITEDATDNPESERFGGCIDAVTRTSARKVRQYMRDLFEPLDASPNITYFLDTSLIQRWHGAPPKVFHIEGRKL